MRQPRPRPTRREPRPRGARSEPRRAFGRSPPWRFRRRPVAGLRSKGPPCRFAAIPRLCRQCCRRQCCRSRIDCNPGWPRMTTPRQRPHPLPIALAPSSNRARSPPLLRSPRRLGRSRISSGSSSGTAPRMTLMPGSCWATATAGPRNPVRRVPARAGAAVSSVQGEPVTTGATAAMRAGSATAVLAGMRRLRAARAAWAAPAV